MKYAVFSVATHPLTGKREARRTVHQWRGPRRWNGKIWPAAWERIDSRWFRNIRRAGYEHAPSEVCC